MYEIKYDRKLPSSIAAGTTHIIVTRYSESQMSILSTIFVSRKSSKSEVEKLTTFFLSHADRFCVFSARTAASFLSSSSTPPTVETI